MSWQVYLSYRRAVPVKRTGEAMRGVEHGEVHQFDTEHEAADFRRRASASTGWAPAGAYDLDVSDLVEVFNSTGRAAQP